MDEIIDSGDSYRNVERHVAEIYAADGAFPELDLRSVGTALVPLTEEIRAHDDLIGIDDPALICYLNVTSWPQEDEDTENYPPPKIVSVIVADGYVMVNSGESHFERESHDHIANVAIANQILAQSPVDYRDLIRLGFTSDSFSDEVCAVWEKINERI